MIKQILYIARLIVLFFPAIAKGMKRLGFIWRFIKKVAFSPAAFFLVAIAPIVDLFCEIFLGKSLGISNIYKMFVSLLLNKLLSLGFHTNLGELYASLPETVLEMSCYFGLNECLNIIFTGIVAAMSTLLSLKLAIFLMKLKFRVFGVKMTKM